MRRFLAFALYCLALPALAGNQLEERLSDSARSSLQASIADRAVPVLSFDSGSDNAHKWIFEMSARLQRRIPDRKTRTELLKTVHYEARRNGLDPQLVLGVMEIESGFRKYAVSSSGARGYMQVMPFWIRVIGEPHHNLFSLRTNLRYGCVILRHYLNIESGDYFRALGRYNGSLGRPEYPDAVHAAWRGRWKYDGATS
ncbi:MAG: lytic transglycosylase domain-containing protein [Candidatus Parcubacteria bacterium]|nr:lytic transglycosylase domain-containing protein [Burkholderiales bacterium]